MSYVERVNQVNCNVFKISARVVDIYDNNTVIRFHFTDVSHETVNDVVEFTPNDILKLKDLCENHDKIKETNLWAMEEQNRRLAEEFEKGIKKQSELK